MMLSFLKRVLNFAFICFVFFSVSSLFPVENIFSEILSHFTYQYLLISLVFLVVYCFLRKWKAVSVASILLVLFALIIFPFGDKGAKKPSSAEGEEVTLLQFNINYRHTDINMVIDFINAFQTKKDATEAPDIVLIQEASPEIAEKLEVLSEHYPYKISEAREGAYGMVLYSKIPIKHYERKYFGKPNEKKWFSQFFGEYTLAYMSTPNRKIPFVLVELHARSPAHLEKSNPRRFELEEIANTISHLVEENKILVGDLNTTPYSAYFKKLEKTSGLRNSMSKIIGTWPNFLPSLLRIPLDHVLVSSGIAVEEKTVEPDLGSDHLPVITKLRISAG
jgi:endonuclease/exonuclease/phosphatase (EEP) superfamily protein YafD